MGQGSWVSWGYSRVAGLMHGSSEVVCCRWGRRQRLLAVGTGLQLLQGGMPVWVDCWRAEETAGMVLGQATGQSGCSLELGGSGGRVSVGKLGVLERSVDMKGGQSWEQGVQRECIYSQRTYALRVSGRTDRRLGGQRRWRE